MSSNRIYYVGKLLAKPVKSLNCLSSLFASTIVDSGNAANFQIHVVFFCWGNSVKPTSLLAISLSLISYRDLFIDDIPIIHSNQLTAVCLKGGGDISSESDAQEGRT